MTRLFVLDIVLIFIFFINSISKNILSFDTLFLLIFNLLFPLTLVQNSFIFQKFLVEFFHLNSCFFTKLMNGHSVLILILRKNISSTFLFISSFCLTIFMDIDNLIHVAVYVCLGLCYIYTIQEISYVLLNHHYRCEFEFLRIEAISMRNYFYIFFYHD